MIAIGEVEEIVLRTGQARVEQVVWRILTGWVEEIVSAVRLQRGRMDRAQVPEDLHVLHVSRLHLAEVLFCSTASVDNSVDERLVA
jgi:hypothetical protein